MVQNRKFALGFRLGALLFALAGLMKQIGVFEGTISLGSFMYYTTQSNLLAIVLFAILAIRTTRGLREGPSGGVGWYTRFEMVCVVNLLVTFVVFWTLLVPQGISADYLWTFQNLAVHAITPLLCLTDYMLFSEAWRLKYRDIYFTTIFPLAYAAFATIAGLAGYVYYYVVALEIPLDAGVTAGTPVRFPYFFLDYDRIGAMVGVYMAGILVAIILLSHGIYYLDRKRQKLH
ncbi:MAG: Pr6Pr family membrane protein [Dehalococcoidia bacterium]|nr:Pr6Pr family membrane protein [Dehalococcoidia bacterium]